MNQNQHSIIIERSHDFNQRGYILKILCPIVLFNKPELAEKIQYYIKVVINSEANSQIKYYQKKLKKINEDLEKEGGKQMVILVWIVDKKLIEKKR